jgi:hypothetical protein
MPRLTLNKINMAKRTPIVEKRGVEDNSAHKDMMISAQRMVYGVVS